MFEKFCDDRQTQNHKSGVILTTVPAFSMPSRLLLILQETHSESATDDEDNERKSMKTEAKARSENTE